MHKLYYSIVIDAPKEKVWDTMIDIDSYRLWTEVFSPGSHYVGDWSKGSKILFGSNETGSMSGMVSQIKEYEPYEYISIKHIGFLQDGKEDTSSELVKEWSGALENYTFKEKDGRTELLVDIDVLSEEHEDMAQKWPEALQKLKQLAENEAH
ncbi:Activator of Hsp90 ATPase 1 family protein [Methanosalsum zhilinae DSM 4017]|uniref:Activator of Hsp90 ATPase 1 family protein n=1 Tax=Methanosalsum zhilinae (strain DSM 4017 / NBRC 107636 / OCM 62 / WeN5) TaxID=679901 RepID=F7XN46_METZD|nr:SRPBCC domain-containing protein [Methanosalsum zhilinae]AEH61163.1 Activator of Hsp90 ATPase 1 family protein [Methanosalsum zhilinae DSM 4017]